MMLREALKVLLTSGSGRAGALFLLVLVGLSLYVVFTYPLDFGRTRWNNPVVWADNPKNAPPVWASVFNRGRPRHMVFEAGGPNTVVAGEPLTRLYAFTFDYRFDQPPTFLSFSLSNVVFHSRPPLITLSITRPDGRELVFYRHAVRGARPEETSPVSRYADAPLRVSLSGDDTVLWATSDFLKKELGVEVAPGELRGRVESALFGLPAAEDPRGFRMLPGRYIVTARAMVYDPADSIGGVKFVVGGVMYGVMGTDSLGRDLGTGLLFGFPVALVIGLVTAIVATLIGTFLGVVSGFSGGATDISIQRWADVMLNIPLLPILIFLIFVLGQRLWLVVVILIVFGWPGLTIVVRSMVLQLRSGQLVEATQALGASRWRIMFRHILFQIAPFVLAQMIFFTPAAILAEAGLSFLGLGDPSIPTWGQILEQGFRTGAVYAGYWWWVLPPGFLIVVAAMTFVLLTLGMEPVVNPRLRAMR